MPYADTALRTARIAKRCVRFTSRPPPNEYAKLVAEVVYVVPEGKYESLPCAPPNSASPNGTRRCPLKVTRGPGHVGDQVQVLAKIADVASMPAGGFGRHGKEAVEVVRGAGRATVDAEVIRHTRRRIGLQVIEPQGSSRTSV